MPSGLIIINSCKIKGYGYSSRRKLLISAILILLSWQNFLPVLKQQGFCASPSMKFKIVRRSINEEEADQVIDLANWGMSRKLIAMEVYGTDSGSNEPHDSSLMRVNHILHDYGVRVTDYRNGRNKYGKATIAAIRREANILDSIRAAQKEVATQIRKTG